MAGSGHYRSPMTRRPATAVTPVDLGAATNRELATRIGHSWVEMRRGASATALRDWLFGTMDDPIDYAQMDVLDLLARRTHWRMSDLADALRVDPSTATRAVHRLVNAGLAERRPSNDDGRVVHVVITPAGQAAHDVVRRRREQLMAYLLGAFDPLERQQMATFFERWVVTIDAFVADLPD